MGKNIYQNVLNSVQEKHHNLDEWLVKAPEDFKSRCIDCDNVEPVQQHLQVLDDIAEKVGNETLGICQVCHGHVEENVLEIDYTTNICLDCMPEDQRRQLEAELEFSSRIQRALLPQQAPSIPGLDISAFSRPAQIIGGDYFDFIDFRSGAHGLTIADAVGHGFSASLLISGLQTALQTLIPEAISPLEVIQRINRYYVHNVNLTTFMTIFLGQFDMDKSIMTYCNAGHNPPLLFRPHPNGGTPATWLKPTAAAVGLVEEYKVRSEQIFLSEGDIIVLYTDGLTEAFNPLGEPFGVERLEQLVERNNSLSAREVISTIRTELTGFIGERPLADDVTVVVCKVSG